MCRAVCRVLCGPWGGVPHVRCLPVPDVCGRADGGGGQRSAGAWSLDMAGNRVRDGGNTGWATQGGRWWRRCSCVQGRRGSVCCTGVDTVAARRRAEREWHRWTQTPHGLVKARSPDETTSRQCVLCPNPMLICVCLVSCLLSMCLSRREMPHAAIQDRVPGHFGAAQRPGDALLLPLPVGHEHRQLCHGEL